MKMAKASEKDIDAAGDLLSLLDQLDRGDYPGPQDGAPDYFDADNFEHLRAFHDAVKATLDRSPGWPGRIIGGMCYVILYAKNEIVDPDADVIELHPRLVRALQAEEDAKSLQVRALEALKPLIGCPIAAGSPSDTVLIGSGNWTLTVGDVERARQLASLEPPSMRSGAGSEREGGSRAARDVLAERSRQVEAEGWTPAHDDAHDDGAMARAAACYALPAPMLVLEERPQTYDRSRIRGDSPIWATAKFSVPAMWPTSWQPSWWKPKDRRRDLVRAGALILAEIERMDRAAPAAAPAPTAPEKG